MGTSTGQTTGEHVSLARLAVDLGVPEPLAANQPLNLGDSQWVWYVERGTVNLFLVERLNGVDQSAPQHFLCVDAGRLLPGVAARQSDTCLEIVAKGLPGTVLQRLPVASLALIPNKELARYVDAWLLDLSARMSRDIVPLPKPDIIVEPDKQQRVSTGLLSSRRGVVWISPQSPCSCLFMGLVDLGNDGGGDDSAVAAPHPVPVTPASWLNLQTEAGADVPLWAQTSERLAERGLLMPALVDFHTLALSLELLNRRLATVDVVNIERERIMQRRRDEETARRQLFNIYGGLQPDDDGGSSAALLSALQLIGRHEGIRFEWHGDSSKPDSAPTLQGVLDASGVRGRLVKLDRQAKWWLSTSGAMLAFRVHDGRPMALVPNSLLGRYSQIDPVRQRVVPVTMEVAASLRSHGWLFYPPLPATNSRVVDLLRITNSGGLWVNLVQLLIIGLIEALIALLPAMTLGWLAGQLIAGLQANLLYPAVGIIVILAFLGSLLYIRHGMTLMRIEGRSLSRLEAALLDRMVRLPTSVLNRYMAGDMALSNMTAFQTLRAALHGVISNAVLSIVCLIPVSAIILIYDRQLAFVAAIFGLTAVVATILTGLRQVKPCRQKVRTVHRIAGRLVNLINGITKLRVAGAEGSAFAFWAQDYRQLKQAELALGDREAHSAALAAALPHLAGAVLFLATMLLNQENVQVGQFLVVYATLMVFVAAVARLGQSFSQIAAITPQLDSVQPFLAASPRRNYSNGQSTTMLGGELLFDHVSFQYGPNSAPVLDDVSLHVRPGEFVAIAGESGAGKSTLFRLALGIDQPTVGTVNYDGRDLRNLNINEVRRQIGTVPQHIQLYQEDIWDNIVGSTDSISEEEVWSAAKLAGCDSSIASMPMSMRTCVGISDTLISGGEAQRIRIARSLLQNPRILLLDEATNWLDNNSQAKVMDSLAGLAMTRIVIAHRLSTLRQADRIYVLQAGKVIQVGSFDELSTIEGVFQGLVRRQMV